MSLTNSQYDAGCCACIRKNSCGISGSRTSGSGRPLRNFRGLEEIDREVAALSLKKARILLSKQTAGDFDLDAAIRELAERTPGAAAVPRISGRFPGTAL